MNYINKETGEIIENGKKYSLSKIWDIVQNKFIAKKEDYYIKIINNPREQYKNYKKVKGYVAKEIKYLNKNSWTDIYGWENDNFTLEYYYD